MSMVICSRCDALIDSDDDPEVFVEIGNMRRLHSTVVMWENCREHYYDELTDDHPPEYEHEDKLNRKD